jgi:GDPmannose 4,6-dehydratase
LRVLITGSSGQDATMLAKILQKRGNEIFKISRTIRNSFSEGNVSYTLTKDMIKNPKTFLDEHNIDTIFHTGAISSPRVCEQFPALAFEINVNWVENLLKAIEGTHTKLIFFGSGSVYGSSSTFDKPFTEESPLNPDSVYSDSKAKAINLVRAYRHKGVWATNLILFNHESLDRKGDYLFPVLCKKIASSFHSRSAISIRNKYDIADWGAAADFMLAAEKISALDYSHDIILASGQSRSIEMLATEIWERIKVPKFNILSEENFLKKSIYVDPSKSIDLVGQYNKTSIIDLGVRQVSRFLESGIS